MNWKILSMLLITTLLAVGDIGGVVYQDLALNGGNKNEYGIKESNELGLKGITVTITSASGENRTTTNENGFWSFASNDKEFRVAFSNWSSYLTESSKGVNGENSALRFVKNGDTNITFGLYDVNHYFSTANPPYVTSMILNGSNENSSLATLVQTNYKERGLNQNFTDGLGNQGVATPFQVKAVASQTGTIWGIGYQASKKRIFLASSLWRHVGNIDNNMGRIFVVDVNSSAQIRGHIDLQGINGIDLGEVNRTGDKNYELSPDPLAPNVDLDAFAKAGKVSFGDLDFDEKSQTIWLVNLFQKGIIKMDASLDDLNATATSAKQYLLSDLSGTPTCIGGELRPWALAIHHAKGYIGMVCDASVSQNIKDLKAHLASFDLRHPERGLTPLLAIDMNYNRKINSDGFQGDAYYFPWTDQRQKTIGVVRDFFWDYHNQPILTDIEFDAKGDAYLAFTDRYSLQIGFRQYPAAKNPKLIEEAIEGYGEIFKVCEVNGKFVLEGKDALLCPEGKSRNGDVDFFDDRGGDDNANSIGGALALIPGTKQLLSTVNSPHPSDSYGKEYANLVGVETFSTKDGAIDNWYAHLLADERPYRGKGVGLGDIEFLNEPAPLELGDRIWRDVNGNGIQDANEIGIEGVKLELYKDTVLLASTLTDKNGIYLFSSDATQVSTTSRQYGIEALKANENYIIRIPNAQGDKRQEGLTGLLLTLSGEGNGSTATLEDSNVTINQNSAEILISPTLGLNNHSLDIGFKPSSIVASVNDTPNCSCKSYETRSIGVLNSKNLIILFIVLNLLIVFYMQEELWKRDKKRP